MANLSTFWLMVMRRGHISSTIGQTQELGKKKKDQNSTAYLPCGVNIHKSVVVFLNTFMSFLIQFYVP